MASPFPSAQRQSHSRRRLRRLQPCGHSQGCSLHSLCKIIRFSAQSIGSTRRSFPGYFTASVAEYFEECFETASSLLAKFISAIPERSVLKRERTLLFGCERPLPRKTKNLHSLSGCPSLVLLVAAVYGKSVATRSSPRSLLKEISKAQLPTGRLPTRVDRCEPYLCSIQHATTSGFIGVASIRLTDSATTNIFSIHWPERSTSCDFPADPRGILTCRL